MSHSISKNQTLLLKTTTSNLVWLFWLSCGIVSTPQVTAQPGSTLEIHLYGGLTITGQVGTVYSIEYLRDFAQTNNATAWNCLEFVQLLASPYLWADKSSPATGQRFYRTVTFTHTNLVFIPPGSFRMGSPPNELDRFPDEGPQMEVVMSRGFLMNKFLVTQGEYLSVTGNNPSYFGTNNGYPQDLSLPVDGVSWNDATNYCWLLTQQELAAGRIPLGSAYRLPTEAEWEYACRALTSSRFSYGDDLSYVNLAAYAYFNLNSSGQTHPVWSKLPNPWGLYDMHGNLWEWCQDHYVYGYPGGRVLDPQGPTAGEGRVLRGGHFNSVAQGCRSASRHGLHGETERASVFGFRVVLAAVRLP